MFRKVFIIVCAIFAVIFLIDGSTGAFLAATGAGILSWLSHWKKVDHEA